MNNILNVSKAREMDGGANKNVRILPLILNCFEYIKAIYWFKNYKSCAFLFLSFFFFSFAIFLTGSGSLKKIYFLSKNS
jgi:hypothetical protein